MIYMNFKTILQLLEHIDHKEVFRIYDLDDLESWIKQIEVKIRSSTEYSLWRHKILNINQERTCSILGIDTTELEYVRVEVHHVIYLYYMVMTTGLYLLNNLPKGKNYISVYNIVEEVLNDHLDEIVPYTVLTITSHQQVHDGLLKLTKDKIGGDYQKWLDKYKKEIKSIDVVNEHINIIF